MQLGDERGDHLSVEVIDALIAESRKDPAQGDAVRRERAGSDVDARGLPARRRAPERFDDGTFGETEIREAKRRELTREPRLPREPRALSRTIRRSAGRSRDHRAGTSRGTA